MKTEWYIDDTYNIKPYDELSKFTNNLTVLTDGKHIHIIDFNKIKKYTDDINDISNYAIKKYIEKELNGIYNPFKNK